MFDVKEKVARMEHSCFEPNLLSWRMKKDAKVQRTMDMEFGSANDVNFPIKLLNASILEEEGTIYD